MYLSEAIKYAEEIKKQLAPHCIRIEIAGSIRRKKLDPNDIEIVCIPKPYQNNGLFSDGIATVINNWPKVKGELPCKYTQRIYAGEKVDIFFATPENWGYILAIRTGSARFSKELLAYQWVKKGFKGIDGMLYKNGDPIILREEKDLFTLLDIDFVEPEKRNL